jgi:hypothetical protein
VHKLYIQQEYVEVRTRVQAARLELTSDDPQVRYDASSKVAQELADGSIRWCWA